MNELNFEIIIILKKKIILNLIIKFNMIQSVIIINLNFMALKSQEKEEMIVLIVNQKKDLKKVMEKKIL